MGQATALKVHLLGSLSATGVINFVNFTFSALLGAHEHYQDAFPPLL